MQLYINQSMFSNDVLNLYIWRFWTPVIICKVTKRWNTHTLYWFTKIPNMLRCRQHSICHFLIRLWYLTWYILSAHSVLYSIVQGYVIIYSINVYCRYCKDRRPLDFYKGQAVVYKFSLNDISWASLLLHQLKVSGKLRKFKFFKYDWKNCGDMLW